MTIEHMKAFDRLAMLVIEQSAIGHHAIHIKEHGL
jgi:hypothetical protein